MDWLINVQTRVKRKNQILFAKEDTFLSDVLALIQKQNRRALVLWAFELADEAVDIMRKRYPNETSLQTAVEIAKDWAAGKVKMPIAQRAILDAHAAAKKITSLEDVALCHAIGQACGVVHTSGHAMGFPIYELTSIVRRYGIPECKAFVENRKQQYIDKLQYWQKHDRDYTGEWAAFLMKD